MHPALLLLLILAAAARPCAAPAAPALVFSDDFEASPAGDLGAPWEPQTTPGSSARVCPEAASPYAGGKQGLRLYDQARAQSLVLAWRVFPRVDNGTAILECDFRADNPESALGLHLMSLEKTAAGKDDWWSVTSLVLGDNEPPYPGQIVTVAGNYFRSPVCPVRPNVWYHVRQVYEVGSDLLDLFLTGPAGKEQAYRGRVAAGPPWPGCSSHPHFDRLQIGCWSWSGLGTLDLDNLRLSHLPGERGDTAVHDGPPVPPEGTAAARFTSALQAADAATQGAASRRGYWVSAADPLTQLFPDTFLPPAQSGYSLSAARGEAESCQLLLSALSPLTGARLSVSDLRGPAGAVLPASSVDRWLVAYEREGPCRRALDRQWWPEQLLPFDTFTVPAQRSRALWLTVHVPREAKPGDYTGAATLSVPGRPGVLVPLRLHVYRFTLPEQPALENDNWWATDAYNGFTDFFNPRDLSQYEAQCRFLSSYRTSCALIGNDLLPELVKITRTGPEQYSFDFSRFDQYLEIAFRYGVSAWNPNMSCNSGFVAYLAGDGRDLRGLDAATGQEVVLVPQHSREGPLWNDDLAAEIQKPLSRQFWQAYVAHLQQRGWLSACNFELLDENPPDERYVSSHRALHEIVPALRLMSYQSSPLTHGPAVGLNGLWAPQLGMIERENPSMQARRPFGDKPWMYVCGARPVSRRGHVPDAYLFDPPLDRRLLSWMCVKYQLDGFLMFTSNMWRPRVARDPAQFDFPVLPDQFWPPDHPEQASIGRFVYPWKQPDGTYRLIPSLRLECLRDGLEDYDYFALLRQKNPRHPLLQIPADLLTDSKQWSKDPAAFLAYRDRLARALE